ncbi:MAG: hypothetical protein ABFS30_15445 [Pseudomonadota bacterium]
MLEERKRPAASSPDLQKTRLTRDIGCQIAADTGKKAAASELLFSGLSAENPEKSPPNNGGKP